MALITLTLLICITSLVTSSKLLLMPSPHLMSHVNVFGITAKGLEAAGHDVHVLVLESRRARLDRLNLTVITYPVTEPDTSMVQSDDVFQTMTAGGYSLLTILREMTHSCNRLCESIHQNEELMVRLQELEFDLVIVDGVDFFRSILTIPYRLGVRYITISPKHDPWATGITALPSVEPFWGIGSLITADSWMYQRVGSLMVYTLAALASPIPFLDDSIISKYCTEKPQISYKQLYANAEMYFINLETVCLDTPRMYGNHYRLIAGIGLETPNPLPANLEKFVQDSPGFIVLTFGSGIKDIPAEMLTKMLQAFSQVQYRVIMRHSGDVPDNVPNHVKMLSWIPQADLLGHPKAQIFITHGGANGQLEGLHHGVPMITIPMFGDQFYNAHRIEKRRFGVTLNRYSFTADELLTAIKTVTKDGEYKNSIRKCTERFHSMPAAQDTINFWINHVIKFGGDHLKPASMHMPLWKVLMVDILAVLMIAILIAYTFTLYCCVKIYRRVSSKKESSKKND